MLHFQNEPPADPRGNNLTLMRCPPNKPIQGIITCQDLIGTRTHFFHGRTVPCDDSDCPACEVGVSWRWHGYVSLFCVRTSQTILFEFTARAAEPLTQYRKAYGSLRGCLMNASRSNAAGNSRVTIRTKPADLEAITLPKEPNLLEALSIIWNIELPAITVDGICKDAPVVNVHRDPDLTMDRVRPLLDELTPGNPNGDRKHE